eukprot:GHVU01225106.1.p1 GENE.GHVU01225106.1~~GHVU01225106.1.p1  ORF type:complete len:273 (+),score=16.84 GHVU01225106.1:618-1436(+)
MPSPSSIVEPSEYAPLVHIGYPSRKQRCTNCLKNFCRGVSCALMVLILLYFAIFFCVYWFPYHVPMPEELCNGDQFRQVKGMSSGAGAWNKKTIVIERHGQSPDSGAGSSNYGGTAGKATNIYEACNLHMVGGPAPNGSSLRFYAIGNWGTGEGVQRRVADGMAKWAREEGNRPPDFLISMGGNFVKEGIKGVQDPQFRDRFELVYHHPELQVLWEPIAIDAHSDANRTGTEGTGRTGTEGAGRTGTEATPPHVIRVPCLHSRGLHGAACMS